MHSLLKILILAGLLLATSCQVVVEDIRFGEDQCQFCKMVISDPKFGAELVTDKGKIFKFDAAECMADYLKDQSSEQVYAFITAIAYDTPGILHEVEQLTFLVSPEIPSPMGAHLSAYKEESQARKQWEKYQGTLYTWEEFTRQYDSLKTGEWKLSETND